MYRKGQIGTIVTMYSHTARRGISTLYRSDHRNDHRIDIATSHLLTPGRDNPTIMYG